MIIKINQAIAANIWATLLVLSSLVTLSSRGTAQTSGPRVIEIVADKDSRYRVDGKVSPTLTFKAGEEITFRITAIKSRTINRNGAVHGFTLLRVKDGAKFPDWNLELQPGTHEFTLKVPSEPGEYRIVCTVICSDGHEDMHMKVIVTA